MDPTANHGSYGMQTMDPLEPFVDPAVLIGKTRPCFGGVDLLKIEDKQVPGIIFTYNLP